MFFFINENTEKSLKYRTENTYVFGVHMDLEVHMGVVGS